MVIDNAWQLLPGQLPQLRIGQGFQHSLTPLSGAQIANAGGCRRRQAGHVKVSRQKSSRQRTVAQDALGPLPVGQRERVFILDEVAKGITTCPRSADELTNLSLPAEPFQAALVI